LTQRQGRHPPGDLAVLAIRGLLMPDRFHIANHLILPFGTAQKFDLNRIKLSSVGGNGIYFTSDIPCVYIDKSKKEPLTLLDYRQVFGNEFPPRESKGNVEKGLEYLQRMVRRFMPNPTKFEIRYLELYFDHLKEQVKSDFSFLDSPEVVYNALLPIPEVQIYVHDPLEDNWMVFEPTNNFRVDFGFWTGTRLVGVEIDGYEPEGYSRDVRRDRLLRRADVDVIHILNTEIVKYTSKVVWSLLPSEVVHDWEKKQAPKWGWPFY